MTEEKPKAKRSILEAKVALIWEHNAVSKEPKVQVDIAEVGPKGTIPPINLNNINQALELLGEALVPFMQSARVRA